MEYQDVIIEWPEDDVGLECSGHKFGLMAVYFMGAMVTHIMGIS